MPCPRTLVFVLHLDCAPETEVPMTAPEPPPHDREGGYLPVWEAMLRDFGDPEDLSRAVDEEIIRYLAAHPEAQR